MLDHGGRRAVDAHVLGPVLEVAGQRHPGLGVHLPALRETAAARIHIEAQALGPCATESRWVDWLARFERSGGQKRTAAEFLALEHPALPLTQLRWQRVLRPRRSRYTEHERGQTRT
jgi:hypothetical protein